MENLDTLCLSYANAKTEKDKELALKAFQEALSSFIQQRCRVEVAIAMNKLKKWK